MRFGRGWSAAELQERLRRLESVERSFTEKEFPEMTAEAGWRAERFEAVFGREPPGPPVGDGPYQRSKSALADYAFSDPRIVAGHFEAGRPLLGRRMLLEIKVLGLRFLSGTVVAAVDEGTGNGVSRFAFRYDTLEGHIEHGLEWFTVEKEHASGALRLRIESRWRKGELRNPITRLGFAVLSPVYRRRWLHRAHTRMAALARETPPTS